MEAPLYQLALLHIDDQGVASRPLIVLNLDAQDEDAAKIEARETARSHRPPNANAFDLVRHGALVLQESLD